MMLLTVTKTHIYKKSVRCSVQYVLPRPGVGTARTYVAVMLKCATKPLVVHHAVALLATQVLTVTKISTNA